jgi:hypothetical protein
MGSRDDEEGTAPLTGRVQSPNLVTGLMTIIHSANKFSRRG